MSRIAGDSKIIVDLLHLTAEPETLLPQEEKLQIHPLTSSQESNSSYENVLEGMSSLDKQLGLLRDLLEKDLEKTKPV